MVASLTLLAFAPTWCFAQGAVPPAAHDEGAIPSGAADCDDPSSSAGAATRAARVAPSASAAEGLLGDFIGSAGVESVALDTAQPFAAAPALAAAQESESRPPVAVPLPPAVFAGALGLGLVIIFHRAKSLRR